jgi:hypothetical protein
MAMNFDKVPGWVWRRMPMAPGTRKGQAVAVKPLKP